MQSFQQECQSRTPLSDSTSDIGVDFRAVEESMSSSPWLSPHRYQLANIPYPSAIPACITALAATCGEFDKRYTTRNAGKGAARWFSHFLQNAFACRTSLLICIRIAGSERSGRDVHIFFRSGLPGIGYGCSRLHHRIQRQPRRRLPGKLGRPSWPLGR